MKNKLNEKDLRKIVKESVKKVLKEAVTQDNAAYDKWYQLLETLGAEEMLNCIYNYCDASEIERFIEYFEQDGYLDSEEEEY